MDLNETTRNVTTARNLTLQALMDPDADNALGFWLNGVGITAIGLMGIFGNLASIHVLSHKQMRSSVNFILMALASSDFVLIVTSILLFALTTVYPYTGFLIDYHFKVGPVLAKVAFPLATIAQTISVYMTFLISLERYIAVCHPLRARSFCTHERTKLSILVIVLLSVAYNLPKFFEIQLNEANDASYGNFYYISASAFRKSPVYIEVYIHWSYCIFMNLIPLAGITFFNLMIYRQVRIVNRLRMKLTSKEQQDIKLTTMLFCVVIVFLSCNCLAVVTNILESFFHIYNDRLTKLSNFLVTLNSSVNFVIYVVLVKKFRLIFIRQFKSLLRLSDAKDRRNVKFSKTNSNSESEQTTNETL
jgi:7 transmembrane receptor (rhodopsin family)